MRPALAALREQQGLINQLSRTASANTAQDRQALHTLRSLALRQAAQIDQLTRGLHALAKAAGIEPHVREAMLRTADVQNPAQPVPEPNPVPATTTTQEAETPEAFADVQAPGLVPGSTNDVAADAESTAYTPGMDIEGPALKQLIDVTAPVDGTQNPQPLSDVRTETDVRVGNPMNPQVAFPLRGEFQNAQRLSSKQEQGRTMVALRLAKLRIATGTAQGDDLEVAAGIERDASLSVDAMEREITTLTQVRTASAKRTQAPKSNLVPKAARVQRTVPSLQATAATTGSLDLDVQDADLFD